MLLLGKTTELSKEARKVRGAPGLPCCETRTRGGSGLTKMLSGLLHPFCTGNLNKPTTTTTKKHATQKSHVLGFIHTPQNIPSSVSTTGFHHLIAHRRAVGDCCVSLLTDTGFAHGSLSLVSVRVSVGLHWKVKLWPSLSTPWRC